MVLAPKVSVIIPCYNGGKYIAEAVDSVLAQTYQDFEIIIADDASNDGTTPQQVKAVAKKDKRIKICTHKENGGPTQARNTAISAARGTYILPLDADDKIAPTLLEKFVKTMEKENADVVYCHVQSFGSGNKGIIRQAENPHTQMMLRTRVPVTSLYKKSCWTKFGGYDNSFREGYEDWDFWLNFIGAKKKFALVDEALIYYRMTSEQSLSDGLYKKPHLVKQIFKKHSKVFTLKDPYFARAYLISLFTRMRRSFIRVRLNKREKRIRLFGVYIIDSRR